jgi:hypothetical protein
VGLGVAGSARRLCTPVNVWVGLLVAIAALVVLWLTYRDRSPELPEPTPMPPTVTRAPTKPPFTATTPPMRGGDENGNASEVVIN